jgi:hypothetical protein
MNPVRSIIQKILNRATPYSAAIDEVHAIVQKRTRDAFNWDGFKIHMETERDRVEVHVVMSYDLDKFPVGGPTEVKESANPAKDRLLADLARLHNCSDSDNGHQRADALLLAFIDDAEVKAAYGQIQPKWYE